MTVSPYHGLPDEILDGIFSTEDIETWKEEAKREKNLEEHFRIDKTRRNVVRESFIIDIEKMCIESGVRTLKVKALYVIEIYMQKCSYVPFLFMITLSVLSTVLTGLTCILCTIVIVTSVLIIHLTITRRS